MAPEAETDEAEYVPGQRSQEWLHLAHVEFIEAEYDIDLNKLPANEVIAIAFATRRDYRASEIYSDAKEAHAAEVEEAKEAAKAEREAAREEREAARAKAKEEKEAAKAKAEKTAEKATKGTAKKAPAASKKSAASRRRAKEAEAEDADPFED